MDINHFLNHNKNSVESVSSNENNHHRAHRGLREKILHVSSVKSNNCDRTRIAQMTRMHADTKINP
jgi:hypothetical protein